jgi:DNA phosphorothioation-associated putative methyltransferase
MAKTLTPMEDDGHRAWRALVASIDGGKLVGGARYLHLSALSEEALDAIRAAVAGVGAPVEGFNVIKLIPDSTRLSLLHYPDFFERAFPLLTESWTVDLAALRCDRRAYDPARNPPVLHRKELLLRADDPRRTEFARLTAEAERHDLFANTLTIGHKAQWDDLLRAKGLRIDGHALVPWTKPVESTTEAVDVQRHRTAMARRGLSTPMQALWRHGYLAGAMTVFDYGCGRGDDLAALETTGVAARGWDPYFRPDAPREASDVVHLGFVLNVIEDPGERREALTRAYGLARRVLAVSALLGGRAAEERHRAFGDGVLTSRNTFQKYFGHEELGEYIATVLGREPVSVGPGLFFVLRRDEDEQEFLEERQRSSGRYGAMPAAPARRVVERGPRAARQPRAKAPTRWEKNAELLEAFWAACVALGRTPREGEFARLGELTKEVASAPVVLRRMTEEKGAEEIERARTRRMGDLSVFLALNVFERRRSAGSWGARAQVDLREFWGSYAKATEAGQALLFSLRDPKGIAAACATAAAQGLGGLVPGESLQVDARLVNELPPTLRVYIGCAGKLYGEAQQADVVKVHIASGKVSLMRYDDYEGCAIPMLIERVKVDLRRQQVSDYRYEEGGEFAPQPLYMKSRYMHPAMEGYDAQRVFDEGLRAAAGAAGLAVDWEGYGPPLEAVGAVVAGMMAPEGMRITGRRESRDRGMGGVSG